jgi:hypothetical protein
MTELVTTRTVLERTLVAAVRDIVSEVEPAVATDAPDPGPRRVPRDLRMWLARLRLLEAVPFSHLVADATLLPAESIRFFHLDRGWTDALVEGALSVGTVTTSDRAALEQLYPVVRDEVDEAERLVRLPGWEPGKTVPAGPAGPVTGFVLRSRMVSGWPALHVRAYGNDNLSERPPIADEDVGVDDDERLAKLPLLRMERLAPAVLLVLIDGLPRVVHVEEPRAGVQYGVDETVDGATVQARVPLRDVSTGDRLPPPAPTPADPHPERPSVPVPFRRDAPGVVHLATLASRIRAVPGTHVGGDVDASEFGIQMLQFPWRAVFGDQTLADPGAAEIDLAAVFRPALGFETLRVRFAEGGHP